MRANGTLNGQMQALVMAFGGAVITAIVAMFVPARLYEVVAGATGLSEIVSAAKPPLGDTARALIAFVTSVLAFALLAIFLLRRSDDGVSARTTVRTAKNNLPVFKVEHDDDETASGSLFDRVRSSVTRFIESRRNGDEDIRDLADLPKLRSSDAHPDAPPRRPISAHRDFGEPGVLSANAIDDEPVEADAPTFVALEPAETPRVTAPDDMETPDNMEIMVDRLEQSVFQRQAQLDQLEKVAARMASETASVETVAEAAEAPIARPQPVLEAVETRSPLMQKPKRSSAEMDAALRSALDTLHRMNARSR